MPYACFFIYGTPLNTRALRSGGVGSAHSRSTQFKLTSWNRDPETVEAARHMLELQLDYLPYE